MLRQATNFLVGLLLCSLTACHQLQEEKTVEPPLLAAFPLMTIPDTLHLELALEEQSDKALGDSISNALFFASLDTSWLREIEHVADSSNAIVYSKGRFPLTEGFDACWVEIRQFWFKHQSLLVYDKQQHRFTDRITVAEWYGGESGQVLTGSWLFDYNGDGQRDLVIREIEHSMQVQEDGEPLESKEERASLLLWEKGGFALSGPQDSAVLVKRFPIRSVW